MYTITFYIVFAICGLLAWPIALIHIICVRLNLVKTCKCVSLHPRLFMTLHDIWHTHFAKRAIPWLLHHSPASALQSLVKSQVPNGTYNGQVFATFHSPWGRLFTAYKKKKKSKFLIMSDSINWANRITTIPGHPGCRQIKSLLKMLKQGYEIAIAANVKSEKYAVPVTFLGQYFLVSSLPARIAAAASVPLTPITFRLTGYKIEVVFGPSYVVSRNQVSFETVTAHVYEFFESNFKEAPHICRNARKGNCYTEALI